MHVVIMGCGRLGSTLAHNLDARGHSVAVIDQNADAFRRLGAEFGGITVTGIGFDRDVLREAGIERADAFAAVSSGDNSNIISARLARETFGVSRVVARIYDARRAQVYERLGIPTVATIRWAADRMVRHLVPEGTVEVFRDPTSVVSIVEAPLHRDWVGRTAQVAGGRHRRPGGLPDALRDRLAGHRRPPCCRTATRSSCWSPTTSSTAVLAVAASAEQGGH